MLTSTSTFLYFAYGANMFSRRINASNIAPSAIAVSSGYILGRRFTFGKVSRDGSGKSNIETTGNQRNRVYGVLYKINVKDRENLNQAEGLGTGYSELNVPVVTSTGTHTAVTFAGSYKEAVLRPYHWHKAMVIVGAIEHGLPSEYIEWLRIFEAQGDANIERCAEREALLYGDLTQASFEVDTDMRPVAVNEV